MGPSSLAGSSGRQMKRVAVGALKNKLKAFFCWQCYGSRAGGVGGGEEEESEETHRSSRIPSENYRRLCSCSSTSRSRFFAWPPFLCWMAVVVVVVGGGQAAITSQGGRPPVS